MSQKTRHTDPNGPPRSPSPTELSAWSFSPNRPLRAIATALRNNWSYSLRQDNRGGTKSCQGKQRHYG